MTINPNISTLEFVFMRIKLCLEILFLFSGLHLGVIAPLLFEFWLIPKISRRKVAFDKVYIQPSYFNNTINRWISPAMDTSFYITFKYFKWKKAIDFYFNTKRSTPENYDIQTASKAEIIISIITTFSNMYCFFLFIFIGIPLSINDYLYH